MPTSDTTPTPPRMTEFEVDLLASLASLEKRLIRIERLIKAGTEQDEAFPDPNMGRQ